MARKKKKGKVEFKTVSQAFDVDGKLVTSASKKLFLETAFIYVCGKVALGASIASTIPKDSPTFPTYAELMEFRDSDKKWTEMFNTAMGTRAMLLEEKMVDILDKMDGTKDKETVEAAKVALTGIGQVLKGQEAYKDDKNYVVNIYTLLEDGTWEN